MYHDKYIYERTMISGAGYQKSFTPTNKNCQIKSDWLSGQVNLLEHSKNKSVLAVLSL